VRVIFPVDRPPIHHGFVTLEGERIVSVGTKPEASQVTDLGSVALLPGLVNAHTHLEFSSLPQPLGVPGMPLPDWIRLVIAERAKRNFTPDVAIAAGLRESRTRGVTMLGEIATGDAVAYAESDATVFVEVIGFSKARAESSLAATSARLEELKNIQPKLQTGISPHAPYTVSHQLLQQLIALARERHLPIAMHLAESAEELGFLRDGTGPFQTLLAERSMWDADAVPRGSRPLDYLRHLAHAPRALVIHGNFLDAEERSFLATHRDRMSLVYCPRTHEYFAHPVYPLAELLQAGVNVALGTDSRASNPDLNLLAEMRHIAQTYRSIDPHEILRIGTIAGAEALSRGHEMGSLGPGKLANLVAIPIPDEAAKSAEDALAAIFADQSLPSRVWRRGVTFTTALE
jgi:cytosine/adenosine deaminase-related metal-dependent hydrolase